MQVTGGYHFEEFEVGEDGLEREEEWEVHVGGWGLLMVGGGGGGEKGWTTIWFERGDCYFWEYKWRSRMRRLCEYEIGSHLP